MRKARTTQMKISSKYKDIAKSGDYVVSSVWTNINGDWKQALYHETKAESQQEIAILSTFASSSRLLKGNVMSRFGLLVSCLLLFFSSTVAAQEQFLDSHGVKIHYTVERQVEPVLLLHGLAQDVELWTGVRKALA